MGEACRIAQVAPYTLRHWENRLGFPRPARRASGHRRYGRADLETIFEIKRLLAGRRLTLAGARKALLEHRRIGSAGATAEPTVGPRPPLRLLRELGAQLRELASELGK